MWHLTGADIFQQALFVFVLNCLHEDSLLRFFFLPKAVFYCTKVNPGSQEKKVSVILANANILCGHV